MNKARTSSLILALIFVNALAAQAQEIGNRSESPVVGARPANVSRRLVPDNTVKVAMTPDHQPKVGARMNTCSGALRDPASGVRYLLSESQREETTTYAKNGELTSTNARAIGNYMVMPGDTSRRAPQIPTGQFLLVNCVNNEVRGIARSITAGRHE